MIYGPGEPHNSEILHPACSGPCQSPRTLWSAIRMCPPDKWRAIARDVFALSAREAPLLMAEAVLERILDSGENPLRDGDELVYTVSPEHQFRVRISYEVELDEWPHRANVAISEDSNSEARTWEK